jgi:hypothetical protein
MGGIVDKHSATVEVDFSNESQADLGDVDVSQLERVTIYIPLPNFGSSNSHVDLCRDLMVASWALETLASCAQRIEITVGSGSFKPDITAVLHGPQPQLGAAVADCALWFTEDDVQAAQQDRVDDICRRIEEYEDGLHSYAPRVPEIVDWYFANLVGGANDEWRSEAPEYYREQMIKFPERQVGYYRSAYSTLLGDECYTSRKGWLLPRTVDIDRFLTVTNQKYRLSEFITGEALALDFQPLVAAEGVVAHFPMQQFLRSRICAGFVASRDQDDCIGPFDWLDGSSALIPRTAEASTSDAGEKGWALHGAPCLIHPTGTLIIIRDGSFQHVLYDTAPSNLVAVKRLREHAAELTSTLSTAAGVSVSLACDWKSLSDEDFEQLCYDLIFLHPKYDAETIRKLGKSRSRDGGRDIEVFEISRWPGERPKKWIFQCKLVTSGASLGATKVLDVGDMLEQYGAHGFGVLTSTLIDATLYDKLDSICGGREIEQSHMSVLELERALSRNQTVKNRFFPSRQT